MTVEDREPLAFPVAEPTGLEALTVEPDTDLELPSIETAPLDSTGPLAPSHPGLKPLPAALASTPRPGPAAQRVKDRGGLIYLFAALASLMWAALAVYAASYQWGPAGQVDFQPFQTAVFVVFAVTPIGFIWIAAFGLRQGMRLAHEAIRARAAAQDLLEPAALAASEAGSVVEGVRLEIEAAAAAAASARTELITLREALAEQTAQLAEAAGSSAKTATTLREQLGAERVAMGELAETLGARSDAVTEAITRQAKMVSEASDLAQTQIGESEAVLAARAADFTAAAADASEAARLASEDLARQAARLDTATLGVGDQIRSMEETLTQQRAALVSVAHTLRADHEDFSIQIEAQRATLADVLANAQQGVADLNEAAASGARALGELTETAVAQARELGDAAVEQTKALAEAGLAQTRELTETALEHSKALTETGVANTRELAELALEQTKALSDAGLAQTHDLVETAREERDLLAASALQTLGALSEAARFERESLEGEVDTTLQAISEAAGREHASLAEALRTRLSELAQAARAEQDALEAVAQQTLKAVAEAAASSTRQAADQNEAARKKLEELSEAAFAASQQAEAVFQSRLGEAQDLIGKSANLIDHAAGKSSERIELAARDVRTTLGQLEQAVESFESRLKDLPAETQSQAAKLKDALNAGFEGLLASARSAAEETQAIDAAFQERVKRNYEMLSEAVRLMGIVSGRAGGGAPATLRSSPAPVAPLPAPTPPAAAPAPEAKAAPSEPSAPAPTPAPAPETAPETAPAADSRTEPPRRGFPFALKTSSDQAGLRPRLKLSPTTADAQVSSVFEPAAATAAAPSPAKDSEGGWTWQDILSSMDDAPVDEAQLADRLIGEIEGLGVDLAALLPPSRIEEIAAVLEAGDDQGARTVVRHLAPAAVRRLSRRTLAEKALYSHVQKFLERYRGSLTDAIGRKGAGGPGVSELLSTDEGRTFLLFDAAFSEAV